jgi:hypothetical protein
MGAAEIVAGTIGGAPAVVLQRSGEGSERRELIRRIGEIAGRRENLAAPRHGVH